MQNRVQRNTSAGGGDFSSPISESDIKRVQHRRRQNALSQMEDDLYGDDSDDAMKKLYESYGLDAMVIHFQIDQERGLVMGTHKMREVNQHLQSKM